MELSVIVPTFNEGPNVRELLRRIAASLSGTAYEVLFVDDSTDDTPDIIAEAAVQSTATMRMIHRDHPTGGLGGAVAVGDAEVDQEARAVDAPDDLAVDPDAGGEDPLDDRTHEDMVSIRSLRSLLDHRGK